MHQRLSLGGRKGFEQLHPHAAPGSPVWDRAHCRLPAGGGLLTGRAPGTYPQLGALRIGEQPEPWGVLVVDHFPARRPGIRYALGGDVCWQMDVEAGRGLPGRILGRGTEPQIRHTTGTVEQHPTFACGCLAVAEKGLPERCHRPGVGRGDGEFHQHRRGPRRAFQLGCDTRNFLRQHRIRFGEPPSGVSGDRHVQRPKPQVEIRVVVELFSGGDDALDELSAQRHRGHSEGCQQPVSLHPPVHQAVACAGLGGTERSVFKRAAHTGSLPRQVVIGPPVVTRREPRRRRGGCGSPGSCVPAALGPVAVTGGDCTSSSTGSTAGLDAPATSSSTSPVVGVSKTMSICVGEGDSGAGSGSVVRAWACRSASAAATWSAVRCADRSPLVSAGSAAAVSTPCGFLPSRCFVVGGGGEDSVALSVVGLSVAWAAAAAIVAKVALTASRAASSGISGLAAEELAMARSRCSPLRRRRREPESPSTVRLTIGASVTTYPRPAQWVQGSLKASINPSPTRLRVICTKPREVTSATWWRVRSRPRHSMRRRSTRSRLDSSTMSMKSMTMIPPISRKRSWRTISSAASRLFLVTVSSSVPPEPVNFPVLMSMTVIASVRSITKEPPEGRYTLRSKALAICSSMRYSAKRSVSFLQ